MKRQYEELRSSMETLRTAAYSRENEWQTRLRETLDETQASKAREIDQIREQLV